MGSLADELAALETMGAVTARLSTDEERDEIITRLLAAIEHDRAALLAAVLQARASGRVPRKIRSSPPF
jgi:hypothetical protein